MKAAPRKQPRIEPSPPMMTMNRTWKDRLMSKVERLPRAEMEEGPQRAGDAAIERADREGEQLGAQQRDADDLGGDVHVADRHPGAADAPAHEVLGDQRQDDDDHQREQVALRRGREFEPEDDECRRPSPEGW